LSGITKSRHSRRMVPTSRSQIHSPEVRERAFGAPSDPSPPSSDRRPPNKRSRDRGSRSDEGGPPTQSFGTAARSSQPWDAPSRSSARSVTCPPPGPRMHRRRGRWPDRNEEVTRQHGPCMIPHERAPGLSWRRPIGRGARNGSPDDQTTETWRRSHIFSRVGLGQISPGTAWLDASLVERGSLERNAERSYRRINVNDQSCRGCRRPRPAG